MSHALLASVLVLAVTALAPASISDVAPSTDTTSTAADDSLHVISGVWNSDADPGGSITIIPTTFGSIMVRDDRRFDAVGFLIQDEFLALTRAPGTRAGRGKPRSAGLLRLRRSPDGVLSAEFATGTGEPFSRRETWKRKGPIGQQPSPGTEPLPSYGDYVYVEQLPEAIQKVPPDYPEWARKKGVSGTVVVQALVGRDGLIKDTRVANSIPDLDDYAVGCVKQWRFKPAMTAGRPVAVWVAIPVKFSLH